MNQVATLNYTFAVNNVGVSPDGSMMAVVGDCNQVHLHGISNSGEYKKVGTLTGKLMNYGWLEMESASISLFFAPIHSCKRCGLFG